MDTRLYALSARPQSSNPIRRGFTWIDLLLTIVCIGVALGMLVPILLRTKVDARTATCADNQRTIAHAFQQYTKDSMGITAPRVANLAPDFANPAVYKTQPNWYSAIIPYASPTPTMLICPTSVILEDLNTPFATSYLANTPVYGIKISRVPSPSATVQMHECSTGNNSAVYRPQAAGDIYSFWHWRFTGTYGESFDYTEGYDNLHDLGTNLMWLDGHVDYRKGVDLRARDFGLTGGPDVTGTADDSQQEPDNRTYRATF